MVGETRYEVVFLVLQVLGYTGNDDAKKYILDGEITLEKIKVQ